MKRFFVEVFPGGKCKTPNPFPKPEVDDPNPASQYYGAQNDALMNWQFIESQRREFQIQGEDLEKLARDYAPEGSVIDGLLDKKMFNTTQVKQLERIAFQVGYLAAKQKYPYSEEDMRKCFEAGRRHEYQAHFGVIMPEPPTFEKFLSSLSPQIGSIVEVEEVSENVVKIIKP